MARKLITAPPDGLNVGALPSDKVALWGAPPASQRSIAAQQNVQGFPVMALTCYSANAGPLANATANNIATANAVCTNLATTDFVLAGSWAAAVANCSYFAFNANIASSNVAMDQYDPTTGAGGNGANANWSFAAVRGAPYATPTWVPAAVPANSGSIQTLTMAPTTTATATATINSLGQLTGITMANVGAGYWVPPTVVITPAAPVTDQPIDAGGTGTATSLPGPGTGTYYDPIYGGLPLATGGSGASAIAVVANGNVSGCIVTSPGANYTAPPLISFIGGTYCYPGQIVQVNTLAAQANVTITNAYVSGDNQITLSYFNSNTANALTPTANNIRVLALNELPAISPLVTVNASIANFAATAANGNGGSAAATQNAFVGLTANDVMLSVTPGTATAGLANSGYFLPGVVTANVANYTWFSSNGGAAWTPANNTLTVSFFRSVCPAPMNLWAMYLTANANTIPASNTSEVIYTLPTGVTLQANAPVFVNFMSPVANQFIGGVRANASNQIALNWVNGTAANAGNPGGWLLVGGFQTVLPTIQANTIYASCTQAVSQTVNQVVDFVNETQHTLVNLGAMKGD